MNEVSATMCCVQATFSVFVGDALFSATVVSDMMMYISFYGLYITYTHQSINHNACIDSVDIVDGIVFSGVHLAAEHRYS